MKKLYIAGHPNGQWQRPDEFPFPDEVAPRSSVDKAVNAYVTRYKALFHDGFGGYKKSDLIVYELVPHALKLTKKKGRRYSVGKELA